MQLATRRYNFWVIRGPHPSGTGLSLRFLLLDELYHRLSTRLFKMYISAFKPGSLLITDCIGYHYKLNSLMYALVCVGEWLVILRVAISTAFCGNPQTQKPSSVSSLNWWREGATIKKPGVNSMHKTHPFRIFNHPLRYKGCTMHSNSRSQMKSSRQSICLFNSVSIFQSSESIIIMFIDNL